MPFWKAGKTDDQVMEESKMSSEAHAEGYPQKTAHTDRLIKNDFVPVEYDPQYILMVNHLKKYFPIKGGMVSHVTGYVKAVDGVTFNLNPGTTMGLVGESG